MDLLEILCLATVVAVVVFTVLCLMAGLGVISW